MSTPSADASSFLGVQTPDGSLLRFSLSGRSVSIGRSTRNDLVLKDPFVSKQHARIDWRDRSHYLVDLNSKAGTLVNEVLIEGAVRLRRRDRILMGKTRLSYGAMPRPSVEFSDEGFEGNGTTVVSPDEGAPSLSSSPGTFPPDLPARYLRLVVEAQRELAIDRPLDEIFAAILDLAGRGVAFERAALLFREDGKLVPRITRILGKSTARPISLSRTVLDRILRTGESVLVKDASRDHDLRLSDSVHSEELRSLMCVPLLHDREVMGILYLDHRRRPGVFTRESLLFLTYLAQVAATKIELKRLVDQAVVVGAARDELQRAAEIQRHLLPEVAPVVPGYELHGQSIPCFEVGGDYYDFLPLSGDRLALGVGDVAGKGLPAALLMFSLHSAIAVVAALELDAADTVARLNTALSRTLPPNRLITLFFATLDPGRHVLTCVNAGQNRPVLLRSTGSVERLGTSGLPLGVLPEVRYRQSVWSFDPGDVLLVYSDGVTDTLSPSGESFGDTRLLETVLSARNQSAGGIARRIGEQLALHQGDHHREDDTTMMVLRRMP